MSKKQAEPAPDMSELKPLVTQDDLTATGDKIVKECESKLEELTGTFLKHMDKIEERLAYLESAPKSPVLSNDIVLQSLPEATPTGNISVKKNPVTLHYVMQQRYSDGSIRPFVQDKEFKSIDEARNYFQYYKKALKENPAELGNLNDA